MKQVFKVLSTMEYKEKDIKPTSLAYFFYYSLFKGFVSVMLIISGND